MPRSINDQCKRSSIDETVLIPVNEKSIIYFDSLSFNVSSKWASKDVDDDGFEVFGNKRFYFHTLLSTLNSIHCCNFQKIGDPAHFLPHLKLDSKDRHIFKECYELMKTRRQATDEDLPRIYKGFVKLSNNHFDIEVYNTPGSLHPTRRLQYDMNKKMMDIFTFEQRIRLQRFKSWKDMRDYLKSNWS